MKTPCLEIVLGIDVSHRAATNQTEMAAAFCCFEPLKKGNPDGALRICRIFPKNMHYKVFHW